MSEDQLITLLRAIHTQLEALYGYVILLSQDQQEKIRKIFNEITTSLERLELIYEDMQTSWNESNVIELLDHSEKVLAEYLHYYELFQLAPDAYLVTNIYGLILEANFSARKLLNVSHNDLIRKPLAMFVAEEDCQAFHSYLSQLSQVEEVQDWEISLSPRALPNRGMN